MINKLSQQEDVQKLGVTNLVYNLGGFPEGGMDYEKSRMLSKIFRAVPVRFAAFFVCIDSAPWLTVIEAFSMFVSKFLRVRMRTVMGESVKCQLPLLLTGLCF